MVFIVRLPSGKSAREFLSCTSRNKPLMKSSNPYQLESNELSLPQTSVTKKPRQDHLESEATDPYLLHVNVPHQLNSRPDSSAPELSRNNLQNFANVRSRWSSHLMGSLPSPSSQSDLQSSYHATSEAFAEPSMMSQFETRENTADYGITAMERSNLYYLGALLLCVIFPPTLSPSADRSI